MTIQSYPSRSLLTISAAPDHKVVYVRGIEARILVFAMNAKGEAARSRDRDVAILAMDPPFVALPRGELIPLQYCLRWSSISVLMVHFMLQHLQNYVILNQSDDAESAQSVVTMFW